MIVFKCLTSSNYKFSKFYIFAFVKVCEERMSSLVAASIFILYKVYKMASQMFLNVNLLLIFLFSLFIYAWRAVKNLLLQTVLQS
jgi:hypothetical protein